MHNYLLMLRREEGKLGGRREEGKLRGKVGRL
jgi:hypothetical protein